MPTIQLLNLSSYLTFSLFETIIDYSERYDLYMTISKTKFIVFSKIQTQAVLRIYKNIVEQMLCFTYRGELVSTSCDSTKEILSSIEQAKETFSTTKNLFIRRALDLSLKIRVSRCYVFSILLYGC